MTEWLRERDLGHLVETFYKKGIADLADLETASQLGKALKKPDLDAFLKARSDWQQEIEDELEREAEAAKGPSQVVRIIYLLVAFAFVTAVIIGFLNFMIAQQR